MESRGVKRSINDGNNHQAHKETKIAQSYKDHKKTRPEREIEALSKSPALIVGWSITINSWVMTYKKLDDSFAHVGLEGTDEATTYDEALIFANKCFKSDSYKAHKMSREERESKVRDNNLSFIVAWSVRINCWVMTFKTVNSFYHHKLSKNRDTTYTQAFVEARNFTETDAFYRAKNSTESKSNHTKENGSKIFPFSSLWMLNDIFNQRREEASRVEAPTEEARDSTLPLCKR